uniref:Reverse transcriptase zinc-binding domain-containing protein n=1 Tax=Arundo donax TaxID=35708 RepID=A0A0A9D120_ARUDO
MHMQKNPRVSVKEVMATIQEMPNLFNLPLSQQAHDEFINLQAYLVQMQYSEQELEQWSFIWGNSCYTSSRMYKLVFANHHCPAPLQWIWKSKCIPRLKFFMWLLQMDRLNTRSMLRRRSHPFEKFPCCSL